MTMTSIQEVVHKLGCVTGTPRRLNDLAEKTRRTLGDLDCTRSSRKVCTHHKPSGAGREGELGEVPFVHDDVEGQSVKVPSCCPRQDRSRSRAASPM
eukprot:CAMPEP_0175937016 /NCGR_PEP_ID=MMETSP0108-20121206/21911_1 /TAXON_ID=195067 ORGANISM="Goniomonas pacifica, Strain CCMP1869" /NCGR_SAMPLE_ID=MMETSP0108 /ASSEMBLY_ACC=CAM_ASM_000204 /LENGTH=96 /DNA_ID=CAMNT_0017261119 /DNA_START=133 /DNA_END=423 /DNA_ORIENTATION=+